MGRRLDRDRGAAADRRPVVHGLAPFLGKLLVDPYDAVRFISYRSLRREPAFGDVKYDFVGLADLRQEVADRVLETWKGVLRDMDGVNARALLLDRNGNLRGYDVDRRYRRRDDREVDLKE